MMATAETLSKSSRFKGDIPVILLVEDNEGDARLALEAFNDGEIQSRVYHVTDGVRAMDFLGKKGEYENAPTPDLIILDLNMPRKDGREVLQEIRKNPDFPKIPIIVLTTSNSYTDIANSYCLNANCYIPKPVDFDQFLSVVQSIKRFWFNIVTLPEY